MHQCDFLALEVGAPDSTAVVTPHESFAAGCLRALPAASFDVVALSLVLSYIPTPRQRGAVILKARQLLPTPSPVDERLRSAEAAAQAAAQAAARAAAVDPAVAAHDAVGAAGAQWRRGMLLLVDTFSVDRKAQTWAEQTYLRAWVESIEEAGFVFLRHVPLKRSHALAFATAPMSEDDLAELATRDPPEMRMRREERGEWE